MARPIKELRHPGADPLLVVALADEAARARGRVARKHGIRELELHPLRYPPDS